MQFVLWGALVSLMSKKKRKEKKKRKKNKGKEFEKGREGEGVCTSRASITSLITLAF